MKNEILEAAAKSILEQDVDKAVEVARAALAEGLDPLEVIEKGFTVGINKIGELFDRGQVFLPEVMVCSDAMKAATEILNEAIPVEKRSQGIKCVIATVEGDIHDIGKGLVVSLFKVNGLEVYDLGCEVPTETIIEKALEVNADIIGTSALLNTTMKQMKKLEDELRESGIRDKVKTIIGGAPVTERYANRIGADAYAENAMDGVKKVFQMMKKQ
ncbi:MAG: corrinoid protein [Clostridia bacterium]|nr:corrinoid protein [Clostridia bacterium]